MTNYIQAFILNMDIPRDFSLLRNFRLRSSMSDNIFDIQETEDSIQDSEKDTLYHPVIGTGRIEGYTVPRNAVIGDVCFFMCQRTATQSITRHKKTVYDMGNTNISYTSFTKLFHEALLNRHSARKTNVSIHYLTFDPEDNEYEEELSTDIVLVRNKTNRKLPRLYSRIPGTELYGDLWEDLLYEYSESGLNNLMSYLHENGNDYEWFRITDKNAGVILTNLFWLDFDVENYAGKIYAIGRVCQPPEKYDIEFPQQFRSKIFTDFDYAIAFDENPVDMEDFKDFISISKRGTFTYVLGDSYKRLIKVISKNNKLVDYYYESEAVPMPLSNLSKDNWIATTNLYRRRFCLEDQFRAYYVNRFISVIGDTKKYYFECNCYHEGNYHTRVDNIIKFHNKYLPIEVKLNIKIEKDIKGQCRSYCHVRKIEIEDHSFVDGNTAWQAVVVIDREAVYLYDPLADSISELMKLDNIEAESDILKLRETIYTKLLSIRA